MNCRFCGKVAATGSAFCGNCGSRLVAEAAPVETKTVTPEQIAVPPVPTAAKPKMSTMKKVLFGVGGALALVLVIAVGSAFSKGVNQGFIEAQQEEEANTALTWDEFVAATGFTGVTEEQCKPVVAKAKAAKTVKLAKARMKSLNKADGDAYAAYSYVAGHDWVTTPSAELDTWSGEWTTVVSDLYDTVGSSATDTAKIAVSKDALYVEFESKVKADCGVETSYDNTMTILTDVSTKASSVSALADTRPWYPKGYKEWEDGLAWKWVDAYDDCYSCSYWHIKVVARDGCPGGVYAEINIESGGTVVDWTNDTVSYLDSGSSALMTFETWQEGSLQGSLTTLTCHAY